MSVSGTEAGHDRQQGRWRYGPRLRLVEANARSLLPLVVGMTRGEGAARPVRSYVQNRRAADSTTAEPAALRGAKAPQFCLDA